VFKELDYGIPCVLCKMGKINEEHALIKDTIGLKWDKHKMLLFIMILPEEFTKSTKVQKQTM
jgi:hypothetical protein